MLSTQNAMKCNKLRRSNRTKAPRKWIYSISCKKEQQTATQLKGQTRPKQQRNATIRIEPGSLLPSTLCTYRV